jgi:ribosomal protein S18 acetylase RimI-like enzyme
MSIAVSTQYRHRGVGEQLSRAYMDLMAKRGIYSLRLGVLDSNTPARRLYEKLGWQSVQVVRKGKDQAHYYVCALDRHVPEA